MLTIHKKSNLLSIGIIAGWLFLAGQTMATERHPLSTENKLKAAYLLNFTKYIHWPDQTADSADLGPLSLCLVSSVAFYDFIAEIILRSNANSTNRQIHLDYLAKASHCQLTYLQTSVASSLPQLNDSVLVVESKDVIQPDTAITFYTSKRKIRFTIDLSVLNRKQVRVSSELLKLARIKRNV